MASREREREIEREEGVRGAIESNLKDISDLTTTDQTDILSRRSPYTCAGATLGSSSFFLNL